MAATIAGLTFFAIGFAGYFGAQIDPISQITFLILPTELGAVFDRWYWFILGATGVWLVTFMFVRLAAVVALILVFAKFAILKGWVPV